MVTLIGIAFGLSVALYVMYSVCLREFRIRLRWPALVGFGLLIGGAMILVLESKLFLALPVISLAYVYPGLAFVLVIGLAWPLGLLLRQYKQRFYEPLK
jgi:hypothetical protein